MSEHTLTKSNISNEEMNNMNNDARSNNLNNEPTQGNKENISNNNNISRKLSSRTVSNKIIYHPRMKELINDKIFQYFFTSYFNSKEYSEFRTLSDLEKLNFMIDLYFFIMVEINKDTIFDLKDLNTEEQINNIKGEIMDRILMLKDEISRKNIIQSINHYNICSINEQHELNDKLQKILNKYKFDTYFAEHDNIEGEAFDENEVSNKVKQYSMPLLSNTNNNNLTTRNNRMETRTLNKTTNAYYNNSTLNSKIDKSKSFIKIEFGKVNLLKIGAIKKGTYYKLMENSKEICFTPEKTVLISKNNNIRESNITHYICNTKLKKFKHPNFAEFVTPLNYKTLSNPKKVSVVSKNSYGFKHNNILNIGGNMSMMSLNKTKTNFQNLNSKNMNSVFIEDNIIFNQNLLNQMQNNLILEKTPNTQEMNNLIGKIYFNDEEEVTFNKNEINKIGLLLLEYVQNNQKSKSMNGEKDLIKEHMDKYEKSILDVTNSIESRIKDSHKFITQYK